VNDALHTLLKQLRLSGLLSTLTVRLHEAAANSLGHAEFLELILQDELAVRSQRQLGRRVKAAGFRELKALDQFDWTFNAGFPKKRLFDLAAGRFIRERRDVLFLGPPGVGKSFLSQAIGYHALKAGFLVLYRSIFDLVRDFLHDDVLGETDKVLSKYLKPDLLIIDDMGMKQLPKRSGECLFEIVMRRYETRSTIMTSNRPLEDWGKLLGDVPSATAILDRFLHHADLIELKGKSYRLNHRTQADTLTEDNGTDSPRGSKPATQAEAPSGSKPATPEEAPSDSKPATSGEAPSGQARKAKKA
jgi:DNA replication protein DnaC